MQIEELDEVQDTRREIISWLEDKLEKAEEIQSLALGMGSSRECINICNGLSRRCASKYFTTDAHLDILKLMIASTKIGTVCKKANTILSELLQPKSPTWACDQCVLLSVGQNITIVQEQHPWMAPLHFKFGWALLKNSYIPINCLEPP